MNIYRATFYGSNGETFKTLIKAKDLTSAKSEVEGALDKQGYFEVEGKGNRYFVVSKSNLVFVEYEVLLNEDALGFLDLMKLDKESLGNILNQISDLTLLAVALSDIKKSEQEIIFDALSPDKQKILKKAMDELWTVSLSEIYMAQEMISNLAALNVKKRGA